MVRKLPLYALLSVYASGRIAATLPNGNTANGEYGLMNAAPFRRSVDTDGNAVSQEERMLDHYSLPTGEPTKRPNTKIPTLEPTHEPSLRQAVAKTPSQSLIKSAPVESFKSPSLSRIDQETVTTKPPTNKPTPILTNTPTAVPTALVVLAAVSSSTIFPANIQDKTTPITNTPTNVSTRPSESPTIYVSPPTSVPSVSTAAATLTPADDKLSSMPPTAMLVLVPPKKFATESPTSSSSSGTSMLSTLTNNDKTKSESSSILSNFAEEEDQVETRISSLMQRIESFELRLQFTPQSSITNFYGSGVDGWLSHDSEEETFVIDQTALLLEEWFLLLASQQQYGTAHVLLDTVDAKLDASVSDGSRYLQVNSTLPSNGKVLSKVLILGGNVTFYKSLLFNKQSSNIPLFAQDGVSDYINSHSETLAKRLQIEGGYHGYSDIFEYLTGIVSSPTQLHSDKPPELSPNTLQTKSNTNTNRTPPKKIPTLNIFIVVMSFGFIMALLAVYTFFSNRGAARSRRSSLLYPTARARAAAHTAASREPKRRKNGSVRSKSRGDDCSKHSKSSRSPKSRDSNSVRSREKRGRAVRTECYYDTVDDGTLCTMKTDGSLKKVRFRSVDSYYGGEPDRKDYKDELPDEMEHVQDQTCGGIELADDQPKEDERKIERKCYDESVDSNDSCESERNDTVTSLENDLVSSDWEVI